MEIVIEKCDTNRMHIPIVMPIDADVQPIPMITIAYSPLHDSSFSDSFACGSPQLEYLRCRNISLRNIENDLIYVLGFSGRLTTAGQATVGERYTNKTFAERSFQQGAGKSQHRLITGIQIFYVVFQYWIVQPFAELLIHFFQFGTEFRVEAAF